MTCSEARLEIDESVHGGNWPGAQLAAHLKACGQCDAEWESQQDLARHLGALRELAAHRPPLVVDGKLNSDRRAQLMRSVASRQRQRKPELSAKWGVLAAAAALILVAGVGSRAWDLLSPRNTPPVAMDAVTEGDGQEGFIAVPYAPALASGEALRVVRTELYPAALVRLGVDMDPTQTGRMPADLLVGEDGYPRAVRVSSEAENNF
jgi:hypothetical protein